MIFLLSFLVAAIALPDSPQATTLARRYREGERLVYVMEGEHQDLLGTTRYSARATGEVRKNDAGAFIEVFEWSDLLRDGRPVTLSDSARNLRQILSLSPAVRPGLPDLAQAPELNGPLCDLLTFYADLWIAALFQLRKPGDHAAFPAPGANSWASGPNMRIAEDAVDFDLALKEVDERTQVAVLIVKHLPPAQSRIKIPAEWMKEPVGERPNNWIQVIRNDDGTVTAEVGLESFEDELRIDLRDGKILSATMENPVDVVRCVCADEALTRRGDPVRYRIRRRIQIRLVSPLD